MIKTILASLALAFVIAGTAFASSGTTQAPIQSPAACCCKECKCKDCGCKDCCGGAGCCCCKEEQV